MTSFGLIALALPFQVLALIGGPKLSDDLYRYVWDGRVQTHGINPYRYPPNAAQLVRLRRSDLWPDAETCRTADVTAGPRLHRNPFDKPGRDPGCTLINRPGVRTIYPPVAQAAFVAAAPLALVNRDLAIEIPAALTSLGLTGLLGFALHRSGRRREWALIYALSPLAALEAGMDGHVDVLGATFAVGALLAHALSRRRAAVVAVGLLLAAATLVKIYPALVGVPLIARSAAVRPRRRVLIVLVAVAAVLLAYAPYVATAGTHVLGYLPGYLKENGYNSGARYLLLLDVRLSTHGDVLSLLALAGAVLVAALRPLEPGLSPLAARAAALLGTAFLLASPGNAWYCTLLIAVAILGNRLEWIAVVAANYAVYFTFVLGGDPVPPRWGYLGALVVVLVAAAVRARGRLSRRSASGIER